MDQRELGVEESWEFSKKILPAVSRTFALNINKLRGTTHRAVLTGYLLFRMADCLEDSVFQEVERKAEKLLEFAEIFETGKTHSEAKKAYSSFKEIWKADSPERELMLNGEKVLDVYFALPLSLRRILAGRIAETSRGMADFQFKKLHCGDEVYQVENFDELKLYCYYVAGVVGKMLTDIFCLRKKLAPLKDELEKYDAGFGLGLQVTNIVKDWRKDRERGWLYVPRTVYDVSKGHSPPTEKITSSLSRRALEGLEAALEYVSIIPEDEDRVRLFCIIPLTLACATLLSVVQGKGNKVSRDTVYSLLDESEKYALDNNLLKKRFKKFSGKIKKSFPG